MACTSCSGEGASASDGPTDACLFTLSPVSGRSPWVASYQWHRRDGWTEADGIFRLVEAGRRDKDAVRNAGSQTTNCKEAA